MFYDLLTIPDPRPSKAHPEHRAARKAIEDESPGFNSRDAGMKAGILVLLMGIACYPRIKAEHDALENAGKGKEKEKSGKRERRKSDSEDMREMSGGSRGGKRDRRMSYVGEWSEYERSRRMSVGDSYDGFEGSRRMSKVGGDRRRSSEWERDGHSHRDWEGRSRRR